LKSLPIFLKILHVVPLPCLFIADVALLPPIPGVEHQEEEEEEEGNDEEEKKQHRKRPTSGPRVQDPYVGDETSSMMLPIFIAMGAFFPILICLCKL
jgi:hypothetical protein